MVGWEAGAGGVGQEMESISGVVGTRKFGLPLVRMEGGLALRRCVGSPESGWAFGRVG